MLQTHFSVDLLEAGCDEAGRGCLAGPVVAAAVILPRDYHHPFMNDSKQLTEKKRDILRLEIEREAIYGVAMVHNEEIDDINILNASYRAMHLAIEKLSKCPELLLIDGNRYRPHNDIPFECVIKGDSKFLSIAAASILAKTYRDEWMKSKALEFPVYDWENNKGYPTEKHRNNTVSQEIISSVTRTAVTF
jgi:ribonuclease HII